MSGFLLYFSYLYTKKNIFTRVELKPNVFKAYYLGVLVLTLIFFIIVKISKYIIIIFFSGLPVFWEGLSCHIHHAVFEFSRQIGLNFPDFFGVQLPGESALAAEESQIKIIWSKIFIQVSEAVIKVIFF